MKNLIVATILGLSVASTTAFANQTSNQTTYTWDAPSQRINGSPIEHPIEYVVIHNNVEYPVTDGTTVTLDGRPESGTNSCVYAVEVYPQGLRMNSDPACVAIEAKPAKPEIQIIQTITITLPQP